MEDFPVPIVQFHTMGTSLLPLIPKQDSTDARQFHPNHHPYPTLRAFKNIPAHRPLRHSAAGYGSRGGG